MKHLLFLSLGLLLLVAAACAPEADDAPLPNAAGAADGGYDVGLIQVDPGHFHAGLVQKYSYEQVDPVVHVYAPDGKELESYLALVERFNTRAEDPTNWKLDVYRGDDYLERMLAEKPGNVMVVAGNNARKIDYVRQAVDAGINVLADKPMVIRPDGFPALKAALASADAQGLVVNDIMTERHEITSILQRALSQNAELFGEGAPSSPENPAISKESVHHFSKVVAGQPLVRPAWFFDVEQQGEGIVDVSTHLVDLILWQLFPGEPIDYTDPDEAVEVVSARSWTTPLTPEQFGQVTGGESYPDYLATRVDDDGVLHVAANGEFVFRVRDAYGKVYVRWDFENPAGGDTHFSMLRGTRADLVIRQDEAQAYRPTLYVAPAEGAQEGFEATLGRALDALGDRYPGLTAESTEFGWEIQIPEAFREGHEEHFTRVTEHYLEDLADGTLAEWERTNLLTKYFVTTEAYRLSR